MSETVTVALVVIIAEWSYGHLAGRGTGVAKYPKYPMIPHLKAQQKLIQPVSTVPLLSSEGNGLHILYILFNKEVSL